MTVPGLDAEREAALTRLLDKCFGKPRGRVLGRPNVDLRLLRDAVAHQSSQALQLARECRLPTPERRST